MIDHLLWATGKKLHRHILNREFFLELATPNIQSNIFGTFDDCALFLTGLEAKSMNTILHVNSFCKIETTMYG